MFKLAVFIGRFAPYHLGHSKVVLQALKEAEQLLILTGSANAPPNLRTPFTWEQRANMIALAHPQETECGRIKFEPIEDFLYNDNDWATQVRSIVSRYEKDPTQVCLIGHQKDGTSFYLKLFPEWKSVGVKHYDALNATDIRNAIYTNSLDAVMHTIPSTTKEWLSNWGGSKDFANVMAEWEFKQKHDKAWANAPYTPTFNTVDSMVVQSGHVLLVNRKSYPGKGLWALPGGYLNPTEKTFDGAIRELREETKLKVPEPVLRGSTVCEKVFADPYRSSRGRIVTVAYLFHLRAETQLPRVKGSDDAAKAKWWPLSQVKRSMFFEDHFDILFNLMSRLPDRPVVF